MEINLTQEEIQALMDLGLSDIEAYLKKIAENQIRESVDKQLLSKSVEDKKKLLTVDIEKLNS